MKNLKYYQRETGGIVAYDGYTVYVLDKTGEWISNHIVQSSLVIPMFIEKTDDYIEITKETVQTIINERKTLYSKKA